MESLESFSQVFTLVKDQCKENLSEIAYSLWIKDIKAEQLKDSTAFLKVSSIFKKNIVEEKYLDMLEKILEEILGFHVDVVILCPDAAEEKEKKPLLSEVSSPLTPGVESQYTFNTFIVGSSNKFAHAATQAVAANPANAYNPLFIYGASGLGKTHLLYAVCNEITKNVADKKLPEKKMLFVKGEEFTNELVDAIYRETTKSFHDKYRFADVLLVDDIQFIAGKERTQEEFFHTFNSLYQDGKQIILTSDRPPKEIKTLEDRLRTRFEWGLIADIQAPDFETRIAIIKRKAELLELEISTEVAEYIANRLKTNIRQLEGVVKKLKAYKLLENSPPSIMVAQNAIRDILNDNQPVPVTIDRIITEVGRTYGISPTDIRSNKRSANISSARQISIYVVREITQISMSAIGIEFGGRDHSTIVYAVQQVEKHIKKDPHYKETIEDIIKNIRNS